MLRTRTTGRILSGVLLAVVPVFPLEAAGSDSAYVEQAVGSYLGRAETAGDPSAIERLAAAPTLDFRAHPRELGRLWVQEIVFGAGESRFRRQAADEAAGGGETPGRALTRLVTEAARHDGGALLRAAARLYVDHWTEASPSRLRLFDLEAGALDAAAPEPLLIRHRSFVPDGEADAIRLSWPSDGGDGAAVVRYDDASLPPDVLFFSAGDRRTVPLAGVARIDFVVAGSDLGTGLEAPVECVRDAPPFWRLEARAESGTSGPRLIWSTASHAGLRGWAVFREEVAADGRIVRTGPELVPSAESSNEPFGYVFIDTSAAAETFYRYTVWAVTDEGLLTRAFAATLETARIETAKLRRESP